MKILLDECVTKHLKPYLTDFEVSTVQELGWNGIKNGKLMVLCVQQGFQVLLTIDKNLQYQQNLDKYPVAIVVLNSFTSTLEELLTFLPAFRQSIGGFRLNHAYVLEK